MPSGVCVVEYHGSRLLFFRAKFRDADGRQVQHTLGRTRDGWTRHKAERELGKLLDRVERERWRKPTRERPSTLVDEATMTERYVHAAPGLRCWCRRPC